MIYIYNLAERSDEDLERVSYSIPEEKTDLVYEKLGVVREALFNRDHQN